MESVIAIVMNQAPPLQVAIMIKAITVILVAEDYHPVAHCELAVVLELIIMSAPHIALEPNHLVRTNFE